MDKENSAEVPFHCSITVIQASGDKGKSFTFDSKNWCVLGSHPDCDIRIKHSNSAPLHALVFVREDGVHLQGIHPDEPVVHNRSAKSLIKEEEMPLQPGDVFFLGERGFRVEFENPLQSPTKHLQLNSQSIDTRVGTGRDEDSQPKTRRGSLSARKNKPKRRVSLVVEKNGERFVAQKGDTEKLLSKSQLARLSGGEGFHTPAKVADEETESSTSTHLTESEATTCTDKNNDTTDLSSLVPTDPDVKSMDNKKPSLPSLQRAEDKQANNASSSRSTTKAEPIASGTICAKPRTPKSTKLERMTKSASKRSSMSARDRKKMVYARLSQGLSAIPRKSEAIDGTTTVGFCTPGLGFNEHAVENDSFDERLNTDVNGTSRSPIRSPLADKSPLLNIQQPSKLRGSITKECRTPSLIKKTPSSVLRSSKSTTRANNRSVAFAARIELERGKHYSPFRPKQYPRTPVPKQELANSSRVTHQKFAFGSSGRPPKPMASLEISKVFGADEKNAYDSSLPECRDDSPVTENLEMKPKTNTIADQTALSQAKEPLKQQQESSASSLTGAITSFIKRLSGTVDDDSDDGDSGSIDEQSSDVLNSRNTACTDAVMTHTELAHFTQTKRMSTTRRLSFLDKVLGAATAVRQVTGSFDRSGSSASSTDRTQCESSSTVACSENHEEDSLLAGIDVDHTVSAPDRCDSESPTTPQSPLDTHSSVQENLANEMHPKHSPLNKTEGHDAIFQRLAHGIEDRALECSESFEQRSDHSDETESIGFSSNDSDSAYSHDTADTFERDLEIAVTQGSAPSPFTPRTASVEGDQGLAGGKEVVSETVNASQEAEEEVEATVREQQKDAGSSEETNEHVPDGNAHHALNEAKSMNATSLEQDHSLGRPPKQSTSEVETDCSVQRKTRKSGRLNPVANVDQFPPDDNCVACPPNHGPEQHEISEDDFRNRDVGDRIALQASLNKLRVVELRDRLRDHNLSAAGKKVELVNRLVAHLLLTPSSSEDPAEINESSAVDLGDVDGEEGRITNENIASVTESEPDNQEVEPEPIVAEPSDGEPKDDSTVQEEDSDGEQTRDDEDAPKGGKDISIDAYRRKTVKELRNILRENNLDIMSKLRKEELIHHMISLNVRLEDEQPLEATQTPRSERVRRSTRITRHTPAAS